FFQAEDGIRDFHVTGVQTCALPILIGKKVDYVFVGSCTNGRIEDFRAFTSLVKGKKKAEDVTVWLVPGSHIVEEQIKKEGLLDKIGRASCREREKKVVCAAE